jgi:hypothetical protein
MEGISRACERIVAGAAQPRNGVERYSRSLIPPICLGLFVDISRRRRDPTRPQVFPRCSKVFRPGLRHYRSPLGQNHMDDGVMAAPAWRMSGRVPGRGADMLRRTDSVPRRQGFETRSARAVSGGPVLHDLRVPASRPTPVNRLPPPAFVRGARPGAERRRPGAAAASLFREA